MKLTSKDWTNVTIDLVRFGDLEPEDRDQNNITYNGIKYNEWIQTPSIEVLSSIERKKKNKVHYLMLMKMKLNPIFKGEGFSTT